MADGKNSLAIFRNKYKQMQPLLLGGLCVICLNLIVCVISVYMEVNGCCTEWWWCAAVVKVILYKSVPGEPNKGAFTLF